MIDYSSAPDVTVEMRRWKSLVASGLFYMLKDCSLEAASVCTVCIRHLFLANCNILYTRYNYVHC